jgi:hypothetical protein
MSGLTGLEGDLVEADEALARFAAGGRQREVQLRRLGAGPSAAVAYREADLDLVLTVGARRDFELAVGERGVGQAVAEQEERLDVLAVIPFVADSETLAVADLPDAGVARCPGGAAVGERSRVVSARRVSMTAVSRCASIWVCALIVRIGTACGGSDTLTPTDVFHDR